MNRTQLAAEKKILKEWNKPEAAGRAREQFNKNIQGHIDAHPLITVPFGDHVGIVSGNLTMYDEDNLPELPVREENEKAEDYAKRTMSEKLLRDAVKEAVDRIGWLRNVNAGIPNGSVPTVKTIGDMVVGAGLWLIIGAGGTGKTPLAHAIAGANDTDYEVVRFGEPLAGYTCDPKIAAAQLAAAMIKYPEVVVDSVKDLMSMIRGAAMPSGITRAILPLFTQWATIAANAGVALYVPVNPSSNSQEIVDLLVEASKSNSTTTVFATGPDSWVYQSRSGEGLIRSEGRFTTSYDKDDLMVIHAEGTSKPRRSVDVSTASPFDISDDDFSAALKRSIRSQQQSKD